MTRKSSADCGFLLLSGYSILGDITDLEEKRGALIEDTTVVGASVATKAPVGIKTWMLTQNGFYSDAANGSNAALAVPGASGVLCWAPEANTVGNPFSGNPTVESEYHRLIARAALTKANAAYESGGTHDEGKILHALGAEVAGSGDTHTTSVDNAASSAAGGAGYLQVTALALGGYTSVTCKVNHSADNSSFVALVTFTTVTAAPAAERKTVTGTVNRYLDSSYAFVGSGSSESVTFFVGFARN